MSYFGATGTPVWISGDVSSAFQSQSGFCLTRIAEANVMYIPQNPPLVLHIADHLMDSIAGHQLGSYLSQGDYCVAAVSLKPVIIRSRVLRANHSRQPYMYRTLIEVSLISDRWSI